MNQIESILNETGNRNMWLSQSSDLVSAYRIKQTLTDQAVQNLNSICNNSNKGRSYLALKHSWHPEYYLSVLNDHRTKTLIKLRTANHKLPIEIGRYNETPVENRVCPYCINKLGDEFHYIMECPKFDKQRKKYIDNRFTTRPNMHKYISMMQSKDDTILNKLSIFSGIIMNDFR